MTNPSGQRGNSLIEVLVTIVVGTIVLGGGVTAMVSFLTQSASAERRTDAQDAARLTIDQVAIQLRSAMSGGDATRPAIESVSDYSIVFLAPARTPSLVANPLGLQHVRYCLGIGSTGKPSLFRQTAPHHTGSGGNAPATAACPDSSWGNSMELAGDVVNVAEGVPLFTPSSDAAGNVTGVAIETVVDVDPLRDPPATRLHTAAQLRNVNRPPVASLTCQSASNGHAVCDASSSSDPDAQTLSYAWAMGTTQLGTTGYRLDQPGLAPGSSHVFTVTVRDSGGLSTSASQTVLMP